MICFDGKVGKYFEELPYLIDTYIPKELKDKSYLIGLKYDGVEEDGREIVVNEQMVETISQTYSFPYILTSSITKKGIDELYNLIYEKIIEKYDKINIELFNENKLNETKHSSHEKSSKKCIIV